MLLDKTFLYIYYRIFVNSLLLLLTIQVEEIKADYNDKNTNTIKRNKKNKNSICYEERHNCNLPDSNRVRHRLR